LRKSFISLRTPEVPLGSLHLIVEAIRHIDPLLLIWAGIIVAFGLFFAVRTWIEAQRGIRAGKKILKYLQSATRADVKDRYEGLSLERVQTLRVAIKQNGGAELPWWKTLETALLLYRKPDGEERWYISNPARELFPPEELFEYSEVSHQSVPGILTAMGLLGTFFALFLGLIQVHDTGSSVTGLPELIDALGGKFFTSIVALAGSVGFVVLERYIYAGKFDKLYAEICARIDEVFPRISAERILLDIRHSSEHTTKSISNISSDFVGKLTGALQTQVMPALAGELAGGLAAHLVPAIQKMESTLERLESQKQNSVVGEFSSLIEGLKTSITSALSDMGRKFHEQLSGSTKSEFASVQETLANTAEMLRLMSGQFESTRSALAGIVAAADTSSRDQARASQEQAAALHQLMNGLIDTLGKNASDNQQKITGALTNVISDLSRKVEEVSDKMVHSVANAAQGSQDAA
jgi:predicted transcriptional regulator